MDIPSDSVLRLAQQVGATVSSVSTGRVEFTHEQLQRYFHGAASAVSRESATAAYAGTRGYAVVPFGSFNRWVWCKGSRQSPAIYDSQDAAWEHAAEEAAIEEGKRDALARRIAFLATSAYASDPKSEHALLLSTIAGLARGMISPGGPTIADDVQTSPPLGWPAATAFVPDPAVWSRALLAAQDSDRFYRDYERKLQAWFAAALQLGAEAAYQHLGAQYSGQVNQALFPRK